MKDKSQHDAVKEKLEESILNRAILLSKTKKKRTREILSYMDGSNVDRDKNDRPDIIRFIPGELTGEAEMLIGIEHFLVEQVSEKKKNARGSVIHEKKAYAEKLLNKIKAGDELSKTQRNKEELMSVVFDIASKTNKTGIKELKESFLAAFEKHLYSANAYRENLVRIANGKPVKLAFLIEIHSNASDVFLNNGRTMTRKKNDIYPLFDWMVSELEKLDPKLVDYVVIYMRNSLDKGVEDVIGIDTSNIRRCLRQQGITVYEFCDDPAIVDFPNEGFSQRGFEYSVNIINRDRYAVDVYPVIQQAYEFKKKGIPFVAPRSIQAMLYAYGKEGCRIVSSVLIPKKGNPIDVVRKFDEFVAKYPIDQGSRR